ncbi:MAG: VOC family protein [Pseudomonadota bacterium]
MFTNSKLDSVVYYASDLDRTEAFYGDVLGLALERQEDDGTTVLMTALANGVTLVFFQGTPETGNSPMVVFDAPGGGIDDMVSSLSEQGVTIVTPVSHAPGGWAADFADPDGHVLSIYQDGELPRSQAG